MDRRSFIKHSALATAGLGLASSMPKAMNSYHRANDKLVCGVIGVNGMGFSNLEAFLHQPDTDIEIAANTARVCHLGNIALKCGRRLYWDANNIKFINDEEANSYLIPSYRAPWKLPQV